MKIHLKMTDERHFRFDEFRREITYYDGAEENVVIPRRINGVKVTSIGSEAFCDKGIRSVVLPPTLETIGFYAFAFNQLTYVYLPENTAVIEEGSFSFNEIETLRIGKRMLAIPQSAFQYNHISKLVLPENILEIMSDAFSGNPLTDLTFAGEPDFIHRFAFRLGSTEMADVCLKGRGAARLRKLLEYYAQITDDFRVLSERDRMKYKRDL